MPTTTETRLADLASKIDSDLTSLESGDKQRRKLILSIGRNLLRAQKRCKADDITFKDWVESSLERTFAKTQCQQYMAIARYPQAFKASMSINEAAKLCRYAKKHGGELPQSEWKGGDHRTLITLQRKIGRVLTPTVKLVEHFDTKAETEKWTTDEQAGTIETLEELRKTVNTLLRLLRSRPQ